MTDSKWASICLLVMAGIFLSGVIQGDIYPQIKTGEQLVKKSSLPESSQMQSITATPIPDSTKETQSPIRSEVGRDYSLIVGAAILVLIVIGGVLFSCRKKTSPKAGD